MRMISKKTIAMIAMIGTAGGAALLISCATVSRVVVAPPMIPGAKYVGMDSCAVCHEKVVKNFKLTSHARLQIPGERVEGQGCEGCHGPGSLHVDAGGGKGKFIVNPGKQSEACFQCHIDKHAQFNLPHHHPVKEGRMTCADCHDVHGEDIHSPKGLFVARVNETCAKCHREQARPRVFEHEALREGCTSCHNVHGSINDKMLTERDNNLCLKCHGQVHQTAGRVQIGISDHTSGSNPRMAQGTCFSAGCHTAMHGSDVNPHLRY